MVTSRTMSTCTMFNARVQFERTCSRFRVAQSGRRVDRCTWMVPPGAVLRPATGVGNPVASRPAGSVPVLVCVPVSIRRAAGLSGVCSSAAPRPPAPPCAALDIRAAAIETEVVILNQLERTSYSYLLAGNSRGTGTPHLIRSSAQGSRHKSNKTKSPGSRALPPPPQRGSPTDRGRQ